MSGPPSKNEAATDRPLVTVVVLAYNQAAFVESAVRAAFAQTYQPLEIVLSDDCSTDDTFERMQELAGAYRGPHRVLLRRNERNLGITPHFLEAMRLSRGSWIVAAAGDDVSSPERVEILMRHARDNPGVVAMTSSFHFIDAVGALLPEREDMTRRLSPLKDYPVERAMSLIRSPLRSFNLLGSTACWHRTLFDRFPPISADRMINEDMILTWRAKMIGDVAILADDLVAYRRHEDSVSTISRSMDAAAVVDKRRRKSLRVRASLIQIMADVDFAYRAGIITESQRATMTGSLVDFMHYHTALVNWSDASWLSRISYVLSLWRPGKMRPGLRTIFRRG